MVKQMEGAQRGGFNRERGGRGGGRGGGGARHYDQGPPNFVIPFAVFVHPVEGNFLVKSIDNRRFPKFNRGVYLESKAKVGVVDQILGQVEDYYFSVKPEEGIKPTSFKKDQTLYMNPEDLLPMDRVTKPQARRPSGPRQGFAPRGGGSNSRGFNPRGRGAPRGRGSFGPRGR